MNAGGTSSAIQKAGLVAAILPLVSLGQGQATGLLALHHAFDSSQSLVLS
jgi:hypothetical protein